MRHTRLGRSGLTVSVVGLGCNNLGRPGTATETAEAIFWLLSEAASYTTGSILDVSGGR